VAAYNEKVHTEKWKQNTTINYPNYGYASY
jgi:hypothetical protein